MSSGAVCLLVESRICFATLQAVYVSALIRCRFVLVMLYKPSGVDRICAMWEALPFD